LPQKYANRLNLDRLTVFVETDSSNPMYIQLSEFPEIFTYGKHYGMLSIIDSPGAKYYVRGGSRLQIEVKDVDGTVIYSDVTEATISDSLNGAIVFYIWIKEDPLRTYKNIKNGTGTITIVSELTNVPPQWKNKLNHRCVYPIEIRTDLPNTSPILFQDTNLIQVSSSFSESIDLDTNESEYKRSYLNISASHLHTYGGKVEYIEASYREARAQNNEYKVLTAYPLSSSIYEITASSANGLNPISDLQKFPMPWDLRRKGNVEFRLRFLNANGEYTQDINKNNVHVEVTGSITGFTGSKIIVDTIDGMHITSSGAMMFGTSDDNGVRVDFKAAGAGRFVTEPTLEFTPIKDGVDQKPFAFTEKGSFLNDIGSNSITGSQDSSIVGSLSSTISQSFSSIVIGSSGSLIRRQPLSVVIGGHNQLMNGAKNIAAAIEAQGSSVIIGGSDHIISSSNPGASVFQNTIIGGSSHKIDGESAFNAANTILGGNNNSISGGLYNIHLSGDRNQMHGTGGITGPQYNVGIGGFLNIIKNDDPPGSGIIGGTGNTINDHHNAWIIGMDNQTSTADDTVYVQNLDVAGGINTTNITSSIVTSSIIYTEGSNIFGDAISDTHLFNGHITASGNISASGELNATELHLVKIGAGANEKLLTITEDGTERFYVDEDGDVNGDGNFTAGTYVKATNGYFYGPDADTSLDIQSTGIRLRVNDGTNAVAWFDDDQISLGTASDVDVQIGVSSLGGFFDYGTTNFGVGTITPSKKLTVHGDISASGQLHLGNPTHHIGGYTNQLGNPTGSGDNDIKGALGKGYGDIVNMSNATTVAGLVYRLQSNGNWLKADRDDELAATSMLGVAMGTHTNTNGMLLQGFAQVSQSGQLALGQKVYMYDDGIVTGSVADYPSGDFVRVLGHCVGAGNTNGSASIYFNPSNDWIEIA
tara:strand:+ start:66 stop:2855 length:2790 start_codon:yes stop_codon:yes gene_type:complete